MWPSVTQGTSCALAKFEGKEIGLGIKVICEVTLSFTPYPLFQWYPQSNEILLHLSMKC
jgi:hypothetical protein